MLRVSVSCLFFFRDWRALFKTVRRNAGRERSDSNFIQTFIVLYKTTDVFGRKMIPTATRKRKLSSLDSDSHSAKSVAGEELSPVKRSSSWKAPQSPNTKKPVGRPVKANCTSASPRRAAGSPVKSPRKSPVQLSMVTSSFYGQNKPIYLTPLERKAIKDLLPSPPRLLPSPPPQEKKKNKKNVKGGSKKRKVAAASRKAGKTGAVGNASSKTIKLSKLNSSVADKPASGTVAASASGNKLSESRKAITLAFSGLKPKPKIFVGAAFFSTGKKPTSMYKKSAPKSSTRPKSKTVQLQAESEKPKPAAPLVSQQQNHPKPADVQPVRTEEKQPSSKPRAKFEPSDWVDFVNEEPGSPQTSRSPGMLLEKYGITKELTLVLTRTPTASPASTAASLSPLVRKKLFFWSFLYIQLNYLTSVYHIYFSCTSLALHRFLEILVMITSHTNESFFFQ
ncbi:N-acetyltransferase ESCO2 [Liparis tanakae]|uniref:N-acetyltransferase ESCO2 n=1 Tax=Liparis tanakae TaxID=230148 RepID=A0A4Z2HDP1_9TELE|nr:N-acetyltransferase ESCO2 [Liparis tanakae]